jgi:23S rRNA pseudouridine2605 synthase
MKTTSPSNEGTRLNKYIAHCGICSRRKAVELITSGQIKVNNVVQTIPYTLVTEDDIIEYQGRRTEPEKKIVYLLLNKPKDVITTTSDEKGRKSIMDLIKPFREMKLFPVGRLDRHSTGLLLITNDGELTQKLTHPSTKAKKIYQVQVDKPITQEDLDKLRKGLTLEDGFIQPDGIEYDKSKGREFVGIELHSGRNRIIRRMMAHLGYEVIKLDRVYLAGLTKKDLPRGRFRELSAREIIMLKHFVK